MRIRAAAALSLLSLSLIPAIALAQGDKAQQDAMMQAGMPGEQHKSLQHMVGDFAYTMKIWMAPGQPPAESNGTIHGESLLGGRFVQMVYSGQFMGQAFEGRGLQGYDNRAKEYVSSWVDNMDTGIMHSTGSCDGAHKVCTFTAPSVDPASGQKVTAKQVITWLDGDSFKMEMYMVRPGGEPVKSFEIAAKRK
jgi:hypothetical protein